MLACAGDVPTLETVAAAAILRAELPDLRVRVVNVVDLMRLEPDSQHPHGLPDAEFDALFTRSQPVIFAFHGYPSLIHRHRAYTREVGDDRPDVRDWVWPGEPPPPEAGTDTLRGSRA